MICSVGGVLLIETEATRCCGDAQGLSSELRAILRILELRCGIAEAV